MVKISREKLTEKVDSMYRLVLVAAARTRQLRKGAKPLVESDSHKLSTIALEEVLAGKVYYEAEKHEEEE